jgi:hypothetical protein
MKKYNPKSTSRARIDYGIEVIAGLKGFPETDPLAEPFAAVNQQLDDAFQDQVTAGAVVVKSRAGLRIAEFIVEREIRSFARILEASEGGRRGPAFNAIFPDGINPVITPRRAAQARELRLLVERLDACRIPAATQVATEWLPRLTADAERLDAAVAAFAQAGAAHDEAFRLELRRRDEHARAVDELMGRVRATFPEDRAQQDAVFPTIESPAPKKGDETADPANTEPQPSAPDAPVA